MRFLIPLAFLFFLVAGPAQAGEVAADAPEFLLGDIGVRIDLPKGWKMQRWSDWDFKAETGDTAVKLFAWATPYQLPVAEKDLEAWGAVHLAKAAELGGSDARVTKTSLEELAGLPVGRFELSFSKDRGVIMGATVAVEGQMFHMVTVGAAMRTARVRMEMNKLVKRLEVHKKPAPIEWNAQLSAKGITMTLPDGWRTPLDLEKAGANKRAAELGVKDVEDCILAIRPEPHAEPDVLLTCQGGMLLGIVDEHSFAGKDAELRPKLFGKAAVPEAQRLDLADRVGFLWKPHLEGRTLLVAAVPYDDGIARSWILGGPGDDSLDASIRAAVTSSTYSGPHPAGIGDWASYLFTYRLFSPLVLIPLLLVGGLLVLGLGGVGFLLFGRKKDKYAALADDHD